MSAEMRAAYEAWPEAHQQEFWQHISVLLKRRALGPGTILHAAWVDLAYTRQAHAIAAIFSRNGLEIEEYT